MRSDTRVRLFEDLGDDARADGAAALADREAHLLFETDGGDELDRHRDVVARHDHLRALGELARSGHVRRSHVELRTVVREERRVTAALFLLQDVNLALELLVWRHRPRLAQDLAALHVVLLDAAEENADVVTRAPLVEELAEHLDARNRRLARVAEADDLDLFARLHDATLDSARHDRAAALDRE